MDEGDVPVAEPELPGEPLASGFTYGPRSEFPEIELSEEARQRILEKMDSVDEARLRAAESSNRTYIG